MSSISSTVQTFAAFADFLKFSLSIFSVKYALSIQLKHKLKIFSYINSSNRERFCTVEDLLSIVYHASDDTSVFDKVIWHTNWCRKVLIGLLA